MATRMMKLFDPGEMEEYIKRGAARRKDIAGYQTELQRAVDAAAMARTEREQVGETRRVGIKEAGLGERLGRTQEFAKPLQMATTGKVLGEAAKGEYELGRKKVYEPQVESIMKSRADLAGLDVQALQQEIDAAKPPVAAPMEASALTVAPTVARPARRKVRPSVKRFAWEGTPTRTGLTLPGLLAPVYGFKNIADWLEHFTKKGYEYAFPKVR
jgi:hypothetical protein